MMRFKSFNAIGPAPCRGSCSTGVPLSAILVSVVTAPLALVLYGVGIQYKLHWICPTIALGLSKLYESILFNTV
jgi:hypothetical protein